MSQLSLHMLKTEGFRAILLAFVSISLFLIEAKLCGRIDAIQQVPWVTGLATLFFALGLASSGVRLLWRSLHRGKARMHFYLLTRFGKMGLAVVVLLAYAVGVKDHLLLFAVNLVILYFVDMICSTVSAAQWERRTKPSQPTQHSASIDNEISHQ